MCHKIVVYPPAGSTAYEREMSTPPTLLFEYGPPLPLPWRLAVWLSGNALASINVVALRQTRLVPGWVTVCERVNHFGM